MPTAPQQPLAYEPAPGPALAQSFYDRYRGPRAAAQDDDALAAAIRRLAQQGRAAWPGVHLPDSTTAGGLGARAPLDQAPLGWLSEVRAADLYLACACAEGVPAAMRAFDAAFLERLDLYLSALRPSPDLVAETRQALLLRLFIGTAGAAPRIRRYTGSGALGGWVRVIAVRTALNLLEKEGSQAAQLDEARELARSLVPARDPEIDCIRARCEADFVAAFRAAILAAPRRDRAVLRFAFVEGLTPERIGALYGVHRTTAMRWLDAAQEGVLGRTRAQLAARLRLPREECDGILALIRSRLQVTLSALLQTGP